MPAARDAYRDRLFAFIFGSEDHRDWTLQLYNAVNGTDYDDPEEIEINTIREVLYLGMHNDVSFLLDGRMSLYEQQSTYNPNMPVRMLQYAGSLYEKHIVRHKLNKYGHRLLRLPAAQLVVFYNGTDDMPPESELRLSDSFGGQASSIEVTVRMVNVNEGKDPGCLAGCRPLYEYSWTVGRIRDKMAGREKDERAAVIGEVLDEMPRDFVIRPYLLEHKAEVVDMLLTEYNEAEAMELFREDGREEGLERGREEGREEGLERGREEGREEKLLEALSRMTRNLKLTLTEAMDALEIPASDRERLAEALGQLL